MSKWDPQANDIFLQALELPSPKDRAAFLSQACAGKTELRAQVISLLKAHHRAGTFLESPATATMPERPVSEGPGTVIGPYKLLQQIGEGGFGIVFMAAQDHPIRRKVALKIIKPGMDTRQIIARFEAERQALAIMDHPNIAHVFDAGETESGRPYFVMELVKGIPITTFCDQGKLALRERLELFLHVCQAIQHAHHKGIVHRDIKPSNILVTLHDGEPVVKIIDFGIAKAMGQELTDKTVFTGFAQVLGTPLYTSPEQVALSGLDIDTRTDVYSLGVLLYELLTGTTPFEKERMQHAAYEEMRRIIREEDPPRPSTRVTTIGEQSTTIAAQRASQPRRLAQIFKGELDWIVMKALEKDRTRRYDTPLAFAGDIARYLANEAVQARPPSTAYRVNKFVRRHTWGTAVAAAAGLVLVVSMVLLWNEQRKLLREKQWGLLVNAVTDTRLLTAKEKFGEARDSYRKLIPELRRLRGPEDAETVSALRDYATDLLHTGDYQELAEVRKQYTDVKGNSGIRLMQDKLDIADAYALAGNKFEADGYAQAGLQIALKTSGSWERISWRELVLRSELGPETHWKNSALRAQVFAILNERIRDLGTSNRDLQFLNWNSLQFTLQRWAGAANAAQGAPATLHPVKAGNLGDLRAIADLQDGIYLLSTDVTTLGGKPLHATAWVTLVPWDASLYPINHWTDFNSAPVPWYQLKAKPAEITRRFMGLALTPLETRDAGPGGRVEDFALVATATVQLPPGQYRLVVAADDGVRVDVDGHRVMDAWVAGSEITCQTVAFDASPHVLRVEYFQKGGPFQLWLQLQPQVTDPTLTDLQPRRSTYEADDTDTTWALGHLIDHVAALKQRGIFFARSGHFMDAADDLADALKRRPDPFANGWLTAYAQLQAGDVRGYTRICNDMMNRFGDSRNPEEREQIAKLAALVPGTVTQDRLRAVDLSAQTQQAENMRSWTLLAQGIVDYRLGDWDAAREALSASLSCDHGPYATVATNYFLAMSCFQAGEIAQSRIFLDRARQIDKSEVPDAPSGDTTDLGGGWMDWILAVHARQEAEKLFGLPPLWPPTPMPASAVALACHGQFREAAEKFHATKAGDSTDFNTLRAAAYVYLESGNQADLADYANLCRSLLDRFANDPKLYRREQIAKLCALGPSSIDMASLESLLDYDPAKEESDSARSWTNLARGMVFYREGGAKLDLAVTELSQSRTYDNGPEARAGALFYQAMAYWQLGQKDKALSTLQEARQLAGSKLVPEGETSDLGEQWMDWTMVQRARHEAETLVDIHPTTTPQPTSAATNH